MLKTLFKKENRGLLLVIWALAWPTMLEQMMQTRSFPVLQMKVRRTEERFDIKIPLFRNIH